ncbi:hypothetical protein BH10PLA2_BH10PLA2_11210 [soil metagenome]
MGFVDNDEIPGHGRHDGEFRASKLIRAEDNCRLLNERVASRLLLNLAVTFCLQNDGIEKELLRQFPIPLLAKGGRNNAENATGLFRPELANYETSLNGFAEPYFVSQKGAARERRTEREEGSLDLVGVEIDGRVAQGLS